MTFQRRAVVNGARKGDWADIGGAVGLPCNVRYQRGGEAVAGERLEGRQPAQLVVRRSSVTVLLDNADRAIVRGQFGAPDEVFEIASPPTVTRDRDGVEMLAVRRGGRQD